MAERLLAFINSDLFTIRSGTAKSEYWKHQSELLRTTVTGNSVQVGGESGFYLPLKASLLTRLVRKALRGVRQPTKVAAWLKHAVLSTFTVPRMMPYDRAFDAVMTHAEISVPIISPFVINHRELARLPGVFASAASVKAHFRAWSGFEASANIYNHYYYQNILRRFADVGQTKTVLEIGAGNGNFPAILYHDWAPIRVILIDLPETLAVSIPFLNSVFPEAAIAMPHEIQANGLPAEFNFAFLTVDQLNHVPENSIDLAINCHSFQEMTHPQVATYIDFVQRVCRESGLFFTANRIEKIPCGPDGLAVEQFDPPNRMAEFPWNAQNKVVVHEISKLSRLVQLDGVSIRLERIRKE